MEEDTRLLTQQPRAAAPTPFLSLTVYGKIFVISTATCTHLLLYATQLTEATGVRFALEANEPLFTAAY
jgi:hypothetical protein